MRTIQSGIADVNNAACPDDIRCSAQASDTWLPRKRKSPAMAAVRHCAHVVRSSSRRHASQAKRIDEHRVPDREEGRAPEEVDRGEGSEEREASRSGVTHSVSG
jgi:hypothetical protein